MIPVTLRPSPVALACTADHCDRNTRNTDVFEAALIESHELCIQHRTADLAGRLDWIRDEIRDLAADALPAAGHLPEQLAAEIDLLADTLAAINARRAA